MFANPIAQDVLRHHACARAGLRRARRRRRRATTLADRDRDRQGADHASRAPTALCDPLVPGVIEQAKSVFLQANPTLLKDLNEVALKLRAEYAPRSAEVVNEVAKLYAARFTEQELKDTLAFYKSPLGRSCWSRSPRSSTRA